MVLPDGWYLLDISESYIDTNNIELGSGYYWPSEFILVIYDLQNDIAYLSSVTTTYAFNSYFKCDFKNLNNTTFELERSYNYYEEIAKLIVRILLTLAVEILLALAFKFSKKSYIVILITNVVTQIGLNVLLNLFSFKNGIQLFMIPFYILIELCIVFIEALIYKFNCKRGKNHDNNFVVTYTIIANILSFSLGMLLWLFNW